MSTLHSNPMKGRTPSASPPKLTIRGRATKPTRTIETVQAAGSGRTIRSSNPATQAKVIAAKEAANERRTQPPISPTRTRPTPTPATAAPTKSGQHPSTAHSPPKRVTKPNPSANDPPPTTPSASARWYEQVKQTADAVRQLHPPTRTTKHEEEKESSHPPPPPRHPSSVRPAIKSSTNPPTDANAKSKKSLMRVSYAEPEMTQEEEEMHAVDEPTSSGFRLPITDSMRRESDTGGQPTSRSRGKTPLYKLRYGPSKEDIAEAEALLAEQKRQEAELDGSGELQAPEVSEEPFVRGRKQISSLPPPVSRSSRTGLPLSPIAASPRIPSSTESTPRVPIMSSRSSHSNKSASISPSSSHEHLTVPQSTAATTGFRSSALDSSGASLSASGSFELSSSSELVPGSTLRQSAASELIRRFREVPPRSREQREADARAASAALAPQITIASSTKTTPESTSAVTQPSASASAPAQPHSARSMPWWMAEALSSPFVSTASEADESNPQKTLSQTALSTITGSSAGSTRSSITSTQPNTASFTTNDQSFNPATNSILTEPEPIFDPNTNSILNSSSSFDQSNFNSKNRSGLSDTSDSVNFRDSFDQPPPPTSNINDESDLGTTLQPRLSSDQMLSTSDFSSFDRRKSPPESISLAEAARRSHQQEQQQGLYDSVDDLSRHQSSINQEDDDDIHRPLVDDDADDMRTSHTLDSTLVPGNLHPALSMTSAEPIKVERQLSSPLESPPPLLSTHEYSPKLGSNDQPSDSSTTEQRFFLPPDEHINTPNPSKSNRRSPTGDDRDFQRVTSPDTQQIQDLARFMRQSGTNKNRSAANSVRHSLDDLLPQAHYATHADPDTSKSQQLPLSSVHHANDHLDASTIQPFVRSQDELEESIEEDILHQTGPLNQTADVHTSILQATSNNSVKDISSKPSMEDIVKPTLAGSSKPISPEKEESADSLLFDESSESSVPQSVHASMHMIKPTRTRSGLSQTSASTTSPSASLSSTANWPSLPTFSDVILKCDNCHLDSNDMVWCHDCSMKLCMSSDTIVNDDASSSFSMDFTSHGKSCHLSLHGPGKPFATHRFQVIRSGAPDIRASDQKPTTTNDSRPVSLPSLPSRQTSAPSPLPSSIRSSSTNSTLSTSSRTISAALAPPQGFSRVDADLKTLAQVFGQSGPINAGAESNRSLRSEVDSIDEEMNTAVDVDQPESDSTSSTPRHPNRHSSISSDPSTTSATTLKRENERSSRSRLASMTPSPPISPLHSKLAADQAINEAAVLEAEIEELQMESARVTHKGEDEKNDNEPVSPVESNQTTTVPSHERKYVREPLPPLSIAHQRLPSLSSHTRTTSTSSVGRPSLVTQTSNSDYVQMMPADMKDSIISSTRPSSSTPTMTGIQQVSPLPPLALPSSTATKQSIPEPLSHRKATEADEDEEDEDSTSGLNNDFIDRLLKQQQHLSKPSSTSATIPQKKEFISHDVTVPSGSSKSSARSSALHHFSQIPVCHLCEKSPSSLYCRLCDMWLCGINGNNCDRDLHTVSEKMKAHVRETPKEVKIREAKEQAEQTEEGEYEEWKRKRKLVANEVPPSSHPNLPAPNSVHHSFDLSGESVPLHPSPSSPTSSTSPAIFASPNVPMGRAFLSVPLSASFDMSSPSPPLITQNVNVSPTPTTFIIQTEDVLPKAINSTASNQTISTPHASSNEVELLGTSSASLPSMDELEEALKANAANMAQLVSGSPVIGNPTNESSVGVQVDEIKSNAMPSDLNDQKERGSILTPSVTPPHHESFVDMNGVDDESSNVEQNESWDTSVSSFISEFESPPAAIKPSTQLKPAITPVVSTTSNDHDLLRNAARNIQFRLDHVMNRFHSQVDPIMASVSPPTMTTAESPQSIENQATLARVENMLKQLITHPPTTTSAASTTAPPPTRVPINSSVTSVPTPSIAHLPFSTQQAIKAALRVAALTDQVNQPYNTTGPTATPSNNFVAHHGQSLNLGGSSRRVSISTPMVPVTHPLAASVPATTQHSLRPAIPSLPLSNLSHSTRTAVAHPSAPMMDQLKKVGSARPIVSEEPATVSVMAQPPAVTMADVSSTPSTSRRSSVPNVITAPSVVTSTAVTQSIALSDRPSKPVTIPSHPVVNSGRRRSVEEQPIADDGVQSHRSDVPHPVSHRPIAISKLNVAPEPTPPIPSLPLPSPSSSTTALVSSTSTAMTDQQRLLTIIALQQNTIQQQAERLYESTRREQTTQPSQSILNQQQPDSQTEPQLQEQQHRFHPILAQQQSLPEPRTNREQTFSSHRTDPVEPFYRSAAQPKPSHSQMISIQPPSGDYRLPPANPSILPSQLLQPRMTPSTYPSQPQPHPQPQAHPFGSIIDRSIARGHKLLFASSIGLTQPTGLDHSAAPVESLQQQLYTTSSNRASGGVVDRPRPSSFHSHSQPPSISTDAHYHPSVPTAIHPSLFGSSTTGSMVVSAADGSDHGRRRMQPSDIHPSQSYSFGPLSTGSIPSIHPLPSTHATLAHTNPHHPPASTATTPHTGSVVSSSNSLIESAGAASTASVADTSLSLFRLTLDASAKRRQQLLELVK